MFKGKKSAATYDRSRYEPSIRVSICTGEQVAGFRDKQSGRFEEIMLLRNERDLEDFCRLYSVDTPIRRIY